MGCFSSKPAPPNPNEVDLSHFELLKVVGKGGFGKVNAITKIDTNELMALKRMEKYAVLQSSSTLKMVWIERKIMSLTNSPFLCNLQYAFESDKELFLVMPFMQGGDLRFHLKERGTMPVSHCRFYACEMILGLAAMHQCLEIGTMVALADGTATAVEKVTRGMGLVGEDGKMVYAKHDAQVERSERHEAYVMQTAQGEYTVSSNHRLTMRMNRAPTVNLRRAEGGQQEMVVSCWSQDAEGHLLQHEQSWPVSSSEDLSLVKEQEIDLYWDVEQHLQGEEITAEVPLQGSHTELVAQVRSHLLHLRTHNSVLLDGDLFELTAEALHKQWSLLQMDTEHPIVQGRAVPLVDGDSEAVEQGMMKLTCLDENCRALYAPLASDDTVDVCYMMQSRSSSLRHLDAVLGALRLPVEGVAVSELHSSDATSQACVAQLESILSSGARTIVAFGAASRESWTSLAASLPCVSSSSSSTTHGVPSLTLQLSSSRTRHVVTVLFAPSTKEWSRTRSVGRAMAIAAGLSSAEQLEQVDLSCRSLRRECTPLLSFTRQSRRTQFVELEIDGEREEDKRFALANGQLTHNSRIVFRDLKPDNILLDSFGHLRISDFGLACILEERNNWQTTGQAGTRGYQSPEVITDQWYGCEVDCLLEGTPVASEQGTIPVEQVKPGMRLIGEDNKLVRVKSIESRPTEEVYTIAGVDSDAYSVTGNHRLTLRWNSHPTAAIFSDEDGQTMAGYAYYDAWTQKAVRVMWNCEPMDSAEAPEHSATPVVAAVPTAATAGDEIPAPSTASTPYQSFTYPTRLTACAAARAMFLKYTREGVWERPSSLPDFQEDQDLEKRRFELEFRWGPMCNKGRIGEKVAFGETSSLSFTYLHSTSHPSEVLTGTHEEILSQVRAEFDQLDQASYLQRGQLFEMSASELHSRQEEFLLGTKHALVSGRRVMVPRREKHEEGVPTEQGQGWSSTKVMDGNGSYREVLSSSTRASVVYQLFNPSTASPSTGERPLTFQSNTFEQLDKVHRALDIDLAAENALLMELNPSAQTPSSEHASLCTRRILESISTGAETIVAFGEHTHAQWRAAVADGALSHLASSSAERRFGDSELRGLQLTLPTGGRSTLVLFAPHPSLVAQSPLLYTALAITHGLDVAQAVRICTTVAPHERIEFLSIDRKTVATSTVWNIEIDAATPAARRYALGDGTLTHNCWSFGVTIYELLHGVRPWKDWTRLQAAGQAVQQAGAEAGANGAGAAGGAGGVSPDPRKDGGGGMGGAGALQEEKTSDKADSQKDTAVKNMRQIHISSKLDPVTADFLTRILAVDKKKRLGCGPGGWEDVKAHPWLKDVDWDKIARKEVQPPITPDLTRANCTADADLADQLLDRKPREIPADQQQHFRGWKFRTELAPQKNDNSSGSTIPNSVSASSKAAVSTTQVKSASHNGVVVAEKQQVQPQPPIQEGKTSQ